MTSFGRTGLRVTRLGLGTAPLGNLYETLPEAQAIATVEHALAAGINFLDTAPLYGAGQSERRLGQALAGVPRDSFVLSTKVGRLVQPDGQVIFNWTRDGIRRSLDESLTRLGLDRVDIVLMHDPDEHYREALDAAYPTLADLRSQGVIRAVGAGMNQWQMLADFARNADVDGFLLAGRYTLLEQTSLDDFLPLCQQKGISIIIGGVYNSGILATGPIAGAKFQYADASPAILERVGRIQAVCDRQGVPLRIAALRFPEAHPAVTTTLFGAVSPQEVEANLAAYATPIPAALWADLKAEGLLHPDAPTPTA
ncbi:MAG: aldo/keto reductase [Anaerolineae bacterium]|nr:aldo/keto reductase [Anaerolineae bacterium]